MEFTERNRINLKFDKIFSDTVIMRHDSHLIFPQKFLIIKHF